MFMGLTTCQCEEGSEIPPKHKPKNPEREIPGYFRYIRVCEFIVSLPGLADESLCPQLQRKIQEASFETFC